MSRYHINKLMTFVDDADARVKEFQADPASFIERWEARAAASRLPVANGGVFTPEERRALIDRDYGALYAMGAHPYLLLHFARALDVILEGTTWMEFIIRYRAAVTPHGFPSFRA